MAPGDTGLTLLKWHPVIKWKPLEKMPKLVPGTTPCTRKILFPGNSSNLKFADSQNNCSEEADTINKLLGDTYMTPERIHFIIHVIRDWSVEVNN